MKYKFCSIRINAIKYDVTFATKGDSNSPPTRGYATVVKKNIHSIKDQNRRCQSELPLLMIFHYNVIWWKKSFFPRK